jgi:hypothetical protein
MLLELNSSTGNKLGCWFSPGEPPKKLHFEKNKYRELCANSTVSL